MSHWAEIDENNYVIRVLVGDNNEPDEGEAFMNSLGGTWVKTSYNGNIRKNYAGVGYTYDPIADHFFAPQPYPSWTLDTDAKWQAPVQYPTEEGKFFTWDEPTLSWVEVILPTE
jgi:hypothetical protein